MTIDLDDDHVLALTGPPAPERGPPRPGRVRARARRVARLDELQAEAPRQARSPRPNELRTALLSAVSHDLRTPLAAIKASVTSLLQRGRRLDRRGARRVPRHDRRGDRPARRPRRQSARHEPAPDRSARHQPPRRSGSTRSSPRRSRASAASGADVGSTSPRRCRASCADPGCSSARSRTSSTTPIRFSAAGAPPCGRCRCRRRDGRRAGRRPRARASRPTSATGLPAVPAPRRRGQARASGSASRSRKASSRRWAARSRSRTRPGGGLTMVVRLRGGGMTRILVVDDEPQILRALGDEPAARGYEVDLRRHGEAALDARRAQASRPRRSSTSGCPASTASR